MDSSRHDRFAERNLNSRPATVAQSGEASSEADTKSNESKGDISPTKVSLARPTNLSSSRSQECLQFQQNLIRCLFR
jgi:hypothetical protein